MIRADGLEAAVLFAVLVAGALPLHVRGVRGLWLFPLGFLNGTFTTTLCATALVIVGLPTSPAWLLTLLFLLSLTFSLGDGRTVESASFVKTLAMAAAPFWFLVLCIRRANVHSWTVDSFHYIMIADLLSNDRFTDTALWIKEKRGLSTSAVHSFSSLIGEPYLEAYLPLVGLSTIGAAIWFFHLSDRRSSRWLTGLLIGALAMIIFTNNRFFWHLSYINGHLIFAAQLLFISAGVWVVRSRPAGGGPSVRFLLMAAAASIVVARPEGFLFGFLALVPLWIDPAVDRRFRLQTCLAWAGVTVAWFVYVIVNAIGAGVSTPPVSMVGPVLLAVSTCATVWVIGDELITRLGFAVLPTMHLGAWALLALAWTRATDNLRQSLDATYENWIGGQGTWGYSLLILAALVTLGSLAADRNTLESLYSVIALSLPIFFLLGVARGEPYRVGTGDSLNRMVVHLIPVAALAVAVSCRQAWQTERGRVQALDDVHVPLDR